MLSISEVVVTYFAERNYNTCADNWFASVSKLTGYSNKLISLLTCYYF